MNMKGRGLILHGCGDIMGNVLENAENAHVFWVFRKIATLRPDNKKTRMNF